MTPLRMMCLVASLVALTLTLAAPTATAETVIVDPGGGGDYDNIPEAVFHADAEDTVLVMPGVYAVEAGGTYPWPIPLDAETPTIVSSAGAAATVLQGNDTVDHFSIAEDVTDARLSVHGFTFEGTNYIIQRHYTAYPGGPVRFTDNVVVATDATRGRLVVGRGSGGLVARSTFTANCVQCTTMTAISVGSDGGPGSPIEDNEISGYYFGIVGSGENVVIRRNHIHDCVFQGIYAGAHLASSDNIIENNGAYGITLQGAYYLEGNIIRGHDTGIAWPWATITGPLEGHAHLNDIYDNEINIKARQVTYPVEFDATMNWWGTSDPEEIAARIYDCNDPSWGGEGCVTFTPWCTAPIPGCDPTPAENASWGTIKAMYR